MKIIIKSNVLQIEMVSKTLTGSVQVISGGSIGVMGLGLVWMR